MLTKSQKSLGEHMVNLSMIGSLMESRMQEQLRGDFPTVAMVRVGDLYIDRAYQRQLRGRDRGIAKRFNPLLMEALRVSRRADGTLAVIDGQARLAAYKAMKQEHIPCYIHDGLSRAQEAEVFRLLQESRRAITAYERFRARMVEGTPTAKEIAAMVKARGLTLGTTRADGMIACVQALEMVHRRFGASVLSRTLDVLIAAWGTSADTFQTFLVRGLAKYLASGPHDDAAIARRLRKSSPAKVMTVARNLGSGRSYSVADAFAAVCAPRQMKVPA